MNEADRATVRSVFGGEIAEWSRYALDVPPEADRPQQRRLLLTRLRIAEFVPPPYWDVAARLTADPAFAPDREQECGYPLFAAMESRLHRLTAQLTHEFFDLPVDARQQRWAQLVAQAQFTPGIAAHLRALQPGLVVMLPTAPDKDAKVQSLVDHLRRVFPLPPPLRAAHCDAFLWRVPNEAAAWRKAVKTLCRQYPQMARLCPDFLDHVAGVSEHPFRPKKPRPARETITTTHRRSGWKIPGWLVAVLVLGILRALSSISDHKPSSPTKPSWQLPNPAHFDHQPFSDKGSETLRQLMEEYDQQQRDKPEKENAVGTSPLVPMPTAPGGLDAPWFDLGDSEARVENGRVVTRPKPTVPNSNSPRPPPVETPKFNEHPREKIPAIDLPAERNDEAAP